MICKGKTNKWSIHCNAGQDAAVKTTSEGRTLVKFSVATVQGYKDTDVLWVNCVTWIDRNTKYGQVQFDIASGIKKGDYLYIEGYVQNRSFTKEDGSKGVDLSIVADNILRLNKPVKHDSNTEGFYDAGVEGAPPVAEDDIPF